MSGTRLWIAVFSIAAILSASAMAQDEKNEIGGIVGRTFVSDQTIKGATFFDPVIHTGKALSLEAEYGRRIYVTPVYAVTGEVAFLYNHDIDLNAGQYGFSVVPADMRAFFVTPGARVSLFPTTAVSPWVSFGAGFAHNHEGNVLIYGGKNPGKDTTSFAIQGGAGLDVKVWRKMSIRGEVRDFWSGEPDFPLAPTGRTRQHHYLVGGGAFWRF